MPSKKPAILEPRDCGFQLLNTMRALQLNADWEPKPGYKLSPIEVATRKAITASKVWRRPELSLALQQTPRIADDEVLIRVRACGVCGSDTHCYETDDEGYILFSGLARLPVTIGHEFSGEIVEIGKDVSTLSPGDAVAVESVMWCGVCTACRTGNLNQCERMDLLGFSLPGAFAELVAVKEKYCWNLDSLRGEFSEDEVFEAGALIEPIGCAYNGMFIDAGGFRPGAYVAIFGAGPIGLAAIMLSRTAGAAKIFAFDLNEARVQLAIASGADFAASPAALTAQGLSPSKVLMDLTRGQGVDLQIEAAGAASQTVPEMEKSFAQNGKMVFLGRHDTQSPVDFNPIVSRANHLVGARGHAGHGTFPHIIRLMASRRIPALDMITSRFEFADVIDAVKRSTSRTDGKIMVRFR